MGLKSVNYCGNFVGFVLIFLFQIVNDVSGELTPPYFNLATGRKIYASATCGVDTDGPELYCKLVGANTENDHHFFSVIQGQVCDTCDPNRPDKNHPPENAIDGKETWWQSPPLSRGMRYNEVNLTIDFGQEFHVAYVFIRMGNSPRPGLWTLEKSLDYGQTWTPWQHFSDTETDCEIYFGRDSLRPITRDDDVICTTEYSKIVPLENGEIPVTLLNNRPSANNYFNSTTLQEWTRATNVRIRLLRTKNLLGHLMSVARQDPTVTRRYFYSIKDISIGGRCMCNGYANSCDIDTKKTGSTRILVCKCQHNTCGVQCSECCPGFEQKKWKQNTNLSPFRCEPCNCFGHSNHCVYSEEVDHKRLSLDIHGIYDGGGVCQNCQHNTEGINCNKCKPGFYRPYGRYWNETNVCQPCNCDNDFSTGNCAEETGRCECRIEYQPPDCDRCALGYFGFPKCRECDCNLNGTEGYHCQAYDGTCPCKVNFAGPRCKECAEGYYQYPECKACECSNIGSIRTDCDFETGKCKCLTGYGGEHCERCEHGYYGYPTCKYCGCDVHGTETEICDKKEGVCLCRQGYSGARCDQCMPGYYNYPDCVPCNCSTIGSASKACDVSGRCACLPNFAGKQCTACKSGFYSYPECLKCECDVHGAHGISCNSEGQCNCLHSFDGKKCEMCKEGFYNFPACEECNCDPAGVIPRFAGCGSAPAGELCQCKERVTGRICDQCRPLYWNLTVYNADGCQLCDCNLDGTVGSLDTCHSKTGQCACKPLVQGRQCKECKDGTFDLYGTNLFGCKDCGCDIGGSRNPYCNKMTGQCDCHPRVSGRTCSHALTTHYYPTLHQFQFEYEDGYTPGGKAVRYQYDENAFPDFSRKGYAVFSSNQNEVINEVNIFKSSVYRMVIRYVNPTSENVTAKIVITSDNPNELDQNAKVLFKPSLVPQFVTVSGTRGEIPSHIVLDPGRYTISINSNKNIFLDYFVLLPAAYYEASILTRNIGNPCKIGRTELCRHFKYPVLFDYNPTVIGLIYAEDKPIFPTELYTDDAHMNAIEETLSFPLLGNIQKSLVYVLEIAQPGRYILVIDYVTDRRHSDTFFANVRIKGDNDYQTAVLYPCLYTMVCRQPVIDHDSREKVFFLNASRAEVELYYEQDDNLQVAIKSVTAIPYDEWSNDFINPSSVCVMDDGKCVETKYRTIPESKKIEFELDHEALIPFKLPPDMYNNETRLIYLDSLNATIEIKSKVTSPGPYVIILKYYQPYHPKFKVTFKVTTERQNYEGTVYIHHCPSNGGCQAVVRPASGYRVFDIDNEFTFNLTNIKPRGVYFDYFLIVPADLYNDRLLQEEEFDQTKKFIQECGQDHFHIQLNASEFCRKAVFSLTADYNDGALQCNCDYEGSNSFECDPFGGQCQCRPNVIGRQCDQCRTGFYGFPDCKHCDCPITALCEKDTGECICPPRVTGDKCDQCQPFTYGFHRIIGCEECNCNPLGVNRGNLQCDLNNGSCDCRQHIEGRSCDYCANGYFNFPHCDKCRCSIEGTKFEICDKVDETCLCKRNVIGQACDRCVEGTFNLQKSNPDGCTKCFCFGKTTRCESAYLRVYNVSMMRNPFITTIINKDKIIFFNRWAMTPEEIMVNETTLQVDRIEDVGHVYFGVLDYLLNQKNHLTAYGGYLGYNLYYTTGPFGKALIAPDVILQSNSSILLHTSYKQPANAKLFRGSVQLIESNFENEDGSAVTRAEFMMVLADLIAIHIRATYWEKTVICYLSDVYLTIADEDELNYNLYEKLPVEKCSCPSGYTGLSCEECAPGYYRDPDGAYGGFCIPCQCNGHAETCDCMTGKCHNCTHFTTGDHCDKCIEGYHGDATYGTPHDCMICACPLPYDSNNFATECEISDSGNKIFCHCKPGYTGPRCESCASGYYGIPERLGDYCKPCDCSGNIDPSAPGSCDTVTGECLLCLNNTFGAACNLCAPGYYGDAIKLKDCRNCDCEELGTAHCDSYYGTCTCHDNVIGHRCDQCALDHYGYDSGLGCKPCECGEASYASQCDGHTGACQCKPGVTGRRCDHCAVDYWNYTRDGCIPCSCNKGYSRGFGCNAKTGQCECLPGVIGEKCDACPHRWVLIKDVGCAECDACHHSLLDVTEELHFELEPIYQEYRNIGMAYFTARKLDHYDNLVAEYLPKVKELDPNKIDFQPVLDNIQNLQQDTKQFTKKTAYTEETSAATTIKAQNLLDAAKSLLNASKSVSDDVNNTIREVEQLAHSFDTSGSTLIDNAVREAEAMLEKLLKHEVDLGPSTLQRERANKIFKQSEEFALPVQLQEKDLLSFKTDVKNFTNKLKDLQNKSAIALDNSKEVELFNAKNQLAFINSKFDTVENQTRDAQNNIEKANELIINGGLTIQAIDNRMDELMKTLDKLKDTNTQVHDYLSAVDKDFENVKPFVTLASDHANNLTDLAEGLAAQYIDIEVKSEKALKAATAYTNIINAVSDAQNSVDEAKQAVQNATQLGKGLNHRSGETSKNASDLLSKAIRYVERVELDLEPHVNNSTDRVTEIENLTKSTNEKLNNLAIALDELPSEYDILIWHRVYANASEAQQTANSAADICKPITNTIATDLEMTKKVTKDVDVARKGMVQASSQINRIEEITPTLNQLLENVAKKQEEVSLVSDELRTSLEQLKNQIEEARSVANSIKVGITFQPESTLELKPPESASLLGTNTKISVFFNTTNPNGLIMFLGNENKTTQAGQRLRRNEDFIALEVENGYPILRIDVGNGPEKLIVEKYVANGAWYQAVVDRTGKNVKFSINDELKNGTVVTYDTNQELRGTSSVFNIDKGSKLFVGGYPPDFIMPDEVTLVSFQGQIENLKIGEEEMGLWNFVDAVEINKGARQRNILVAQETVSNGYRFNGNGYVSVDGRGFNFKKRASIQFRFRTPRETSDGLIFYAGKNDDFISVQMKDGDIHFHYKMAGYYADMTHPSLNDDQWHTVEAGRDGRTSLLKIDGQIVYKEEQGHSEDENLQISDELFFGGFPGRTNHSEIVTKNFDGCIMDVTVTSQEVDLKQNLKAIGVKPGCPDKFARSLSYSPGKPGYLKTKNVNANNSLEINLRMRTKQKDGIIFYATNSDQTATASLALVDGSIVFISGQTNLTTGQQKYNDGEWHSISAIHDKQELTLSVNDFEILRSHYMSELYISNGDIYFGGLPSSYRPKKNVLPTLAYFVGCINDVVMNGNVVNFANTTDKSSANINECSSDIFDYDVNMYPIQYLGDHVDPYVPIESTETVPAAIGVTEKPLFPPKQQNGTSDPKDSNVTMITDKYDGVVPPTAPPRPAVDPPVVTVPTVVPTKRPEITPPKKPGKKKPYVAVPEPECVLPLEPKYDNDTSVVGFRFGLSAGSRVEYQENLRAQRHKKHFEIGFKFRTDSQFGILFYAVDNRSSDFIAVFLEEGHVYYAFQINRINERMKSKLVHSDGNWHRVVINREAGRAHLIIDDLDQAYVEFDEGRNVPNQHMIFLGAVDPLRNEAAAANLKYNSSLYFEGCIRDLEINGVSDIKPRNAIRVLPCVDTVEPGVFFGVEGGWLKVKESFQVGSEMTISFDIKPRSTTALLLSVFGRNSYMIIELIEGVVKLSVKNNNADEIVAVFKDENLNFCDGKWRTIEAIKSQYVITLNVDGVGTQPAIGSTSSTTADTSRPLFLGGHQFLSKLKNIKARKPYHGCMRNIKIKTEMETLTPEMGGDHVFVGVCPTV